jgi:hypothetical protein
MIGMERTIIQNLLNWIWYYFKTAILCIIIAFGITKAITNYLQANWRIVWQKNLLVGFGHTYSFYLIYAESCRWVIFCQYSLGINQGLTWSSTVVMKIDLVEKSGLEWDSMSLPVFCRWISSFSIRLYQLKIWITPYPFTRWNFY